MEKKALSDLIDLDDPAWPAIQKMISNAANSVEILSSERKHSETILCYLQVTTRSTLGAIALETGGLLIDHGWLRFLGSGNEQMQGNLCSWNSNGKNPEEFLVEGALIVAYDIIGGFFTINGGAFAGKTGNIFYFAPDTLKWEDINKSYTQFLEWAIMGNLNIFYENMRWPHWEEAISTISGDNGISIYPFPFLNQEIPISSRSRRTVSMHELWKIYADLSKQIGELPQGAKIQFTIKCDGE